MPTNAETSETTNVTTTEPTAPVEGAAPTEGTDPPAPPLSPEELAAQTAAKEREERKARLRSVAENKAAQWRAKQGEKAAREQARRAEEQRQADLARAAEERQANAGRLSAAEQWERVKSDPEKALEFLEANGLTAQQLSQAALKSGTPEQIIQRAIALAKAEAEAAASKKIQEYQDEMSKRERQAEAARANAAFVQMLQTDNASTRWPAVTALFNDAQLIAAANDIAERAVSRNIILSFEDIADLLEEQAQPRYMKVKDRFGPSSAHNGKSTPGGTPNPAVADRTNATRAPALTNQAGSPTGLPENFDKLPKEKQSEFWVNRYHELARKR